jgi:hypothetical protein
VRWGTDGRQSGGDGGLGTAASSGQRRLVGGSGGWGGGGVWSGGVGVWSGCGRGREETKMSPRVRCSAHIILIPIDQCTGPTGIT